MARASTIPDTQAEWMLFMYRYFLNGIKTPKSTAPREWLNRKGLSFELSGAGFNSGQIHHRREQSFKEALANIGFMTRSDAPVNCETVPYTVFGIFSVMFPLRNKAGEIVNFYAIRIKSDNCAYMNEAGGLYPAYPHEQTKKLFVVNSILDAATMLEARVLDNREAVMALHDGKCMPEHEEAIASLKELREIIYLDTALLKAKKEKTIWDKNKK